MNRRVEFLPHGWRDLESLDRNLQQRVLQALQRYAATQLGDIKPLQGRPGKYRGSANGESSFTSIDPEVVAVFRSDNCG